MRICFVSIDAKYIHTNLAARILSKTIEETCSLKPQILEFTINHHYSTILKELFKQAADVYLFSCYIWNVRFIQDIIPELKKLYPKAYIAIGGPQVSYSPEKFLENNRQADAVLYGEGENALPVLVSALQNNTPLEDVPSLVFRRHTRIITTNPGDSVELDNIHFPYSEEEMRSGRILYYESMRGCPFNCSYCLSSAQQGVRLKSIDKVKNELEIFLQYKPKQVKLADRTFNVKKSHAMAIWQFLCEKDNGVTNFHFELAAELLDDEMISFLKTVRPGLFQFEIGVQSTNVQTLKEIRRPADLERLFHIISKLQKANNIHLHLDLIAGLPFEDYESFQNSFNTVYAANPAQLQLGMLKILDGSGLGYNIKKYGIDHTDYPPFEVLKTKWISYDELCSLSQIADIVELYYNSRRFQNVINELIKYFESPFDFYKKLTQCYWHRGFEYSAMSKIGLYELFRLMSERFGFVLSKKLQWLCRLDLALHEKPKKFPDWVDAGDVRSFNREALDFYRNKDNIARFLPEYTALEPKQILRTAHIECLPFNPFTHEEKPCVLLFNYACRDIFGRARVYEIGEAWKNSIAGL